MRCMQIATLLIAGPIIVMLYMVYSPTGFRSWGIFYNSSESLPRGWYRVEKRQGIRRGDTLLTCLPPEIGRFAVRRGYVLPGRCPGGTGYIGKPVRAIAGDTVTVNRHAVTINSWAPVIAPAQQRDRRGRTINGLTGRHVLKSNECFILSTNSPHSFDSRYFGAVPCTPPFFVLQIARRRKTR